jgi:hypothetical protein
MDQGTVDQRRREIRSALISFTAALQIHEYQTMRGTRRTLGETIICRSKRTSFEGKRGAYSVWALPGDSWHRR